MPKPRITRKTIAAAKPIKAKRSLSAKAVDDGDIATLPFVENGQTKAKLQPGKRQIQITAPDFETAEFAVYGRAPYMQNRFSKKAQEAMEATQMAGSQARKGKKRTPRDFEKDYEEAKHVSTEGWIGIPANAFRLAMISACRLVGFKMTLAKLCIEIEADGYDRIDDQPLVRIYGEPKLSKMPTRNANGSMDIRARPRWAKWHATVRVTWDADQFSLEDISNLMMRVGRQVGIGAGRPDSTDSAGMGYGLFDLQGNELKPRVRKR